MDRRQAIEAAKIKTLGQYGEGVFMPTKAVTMSENTRSAYQGTLDHWIYPALGELKLPDITSAEISALLLSMQRLGKAQTTCMKTYAILRSLFKMAYLSDLIDRNPMDKVERPKPRKDELKKPAKTESYTAGELKYILDCLEHEPLKWRAYMASADRYRFAPRGSVWAKMGVCRPGRWENHRSREPLLHSRKGRLPGHT